ncbi:MAG: hypothetical protein C0412_02105 [Flavobacterium sp.]|nr:hypothetical protein [Flavobacterium sp.]
MNILKTIVIMIALSNLSFSQIDTTNWYPLQIGNKWHYAYGLTEVNYYSVEVIGDTIMPNGKAYFILNNDGSIKYQRNEDNKYVFEYNRFNSTETILYDFISPDHTIWKSNYSKYYYGVVKTKRDYSSLTKTELTYKLYDFVQIDSSASPPDTIFGAMIDVYPTQIKKGIGVTSYSYGSFSGLSGAIINGVTLGILTSIIDSKTIPNDYKVYQNYPNPFNPITNIKYRIPISSKVDIVIYNSLGQKIKTLVNAFLNKGEYEVQFDGSGLPSGVYYYQLKTNDYYCVNKMLLIK